MKLKKLVLLLLLASASCIATAQTVHFTRTGTKYHSAYCKHLRRSDYTCTLEEALNKGLTPCAQCSPPTEVEKPKEVKQVKKKKKNKKPVQPKN